MYLVPFCSAQETKKILTKNELSQEYPHPFSSVFDLSSFIFGWTNDGNFFHRKEKILPAEAYVFILLFDVYFKVSRIRLIRKLVAVKNEDASSVYKRLYMYICRICYRLYLYIRKISVERSYSTYRDS